MSSTVNCSSPSARGGVDSDVALLDGGVVGGGTTDADCVGAGVIDPPGEAECDADGR
jgi:hypothetical protein